MCLLCCFTMHQTTKPTNQQPNCLMTYVSTYNLLLLIFKVVLMCSYLCTIYICAHVTEYIRSSPYICMCVCVRLVISRYHLFYINEYLCSYTPNGDFSRISVANIVQNVNMFEMHIVTYSLMHVRTHV